MSGSTDCRCNEEWIEFCKIHTISHTNCLATNQIRCMLCSESSHVMSIQTHIGSDQHQKRHKQFMEYVYLVSLPPCSPSQANILSQLLEDIHLKNALNQTNFEKRLHVIQTINELMATNDELNGYSVRIYGSTINSFGLFDSDINLDIVCNHSEKAENCVSIVLSKISKLIQENDKLFIGVRNEYVLKVPKVHFKDSRNHFEIELSITVEKRYRCSKLLYHYSQIDRRVGLLGIAFRVWARTYGYDDQENGFWPALTFPVLAIHFLQRCSPPVLPCLHELFAKPLKNGYKEDKDVVEDFDLSSLKWKTKNDKSVGQLWLEMLRFYAVEIDSKTYVVSIRSTRSPHMRREKHWTSHMLAVEDPICPSLNMSRSVGKMKLFKEFYQQLRNCYKFFSIPFVKMSNKPFLAKPFFTENDFSIVVNQYHHYNSLDVRDLLTHITNIYNELDNGSDDSDCEDNSHLKGFEILKTFGIRMELNPKMKNKMNSIPETQLICSFDMKKMPFFQIHVMFCRFCHGFGHQQNTCPDNQLPNLCPIPDVPPSAYDLLNQTCYQMFNENRIDENEERIHTNIVNDLQNHIRCQRPNARLELFGSTRNGFGARFCDLDICLTFDDNVTGEGLDGEKIIENVGKILESHPQLKNIFPITSAKVPIVKFGYVHKKRTVECDISLYNILARYNTSMLRQYTLIDPRVQVLGFVVKHFAKTCDMCDASRGSLSSYAYSLMTIHYLQQKGIIPVLQEIGLDRKQERVVDGCDTWFFDDLKGLPQYWKPVLNNESVAQLLVGFLRYFSEMFSFDEYVVCCRQSSPLRRLEKMWTGNKIAIEDPFQLSHNLGAGVSPQMALYIKTSLILGRNHLLYPPPNLRVDVRDFDWSRDYFFRRNVLTKGLPPTGRGCRSCGKIGHKQNSCPERSDRSNRQERQQRPEKFRERKQSNRQK